MAVSRGSPFQLVGRGGLLGQVALVASAALGQRISAQAPGQFSWVGSAWRCGPKVAWGRVKNVHGEGHALYQPPASCGVWAAERVV